MKIYFRDEMVATPTECRTPAHEKVLRLMASLCQHEHSDIIQDFPSVSWDRWDGIHDPDYVRRIAMADGQTFEAASVPVSATMVNSVAFGAGSLVAATSAAIENGCAFSPTAGFHHAHWSHPGPLCLLNALPLAAVHALAHADVNKVLILDCDFHRGDGTEDILTRIDDTRISHRSLGFTFSNRSHSEAYMLEIERICRTIDSRNYDLVIYQAGMDVLVGDPAGGGILSLSETRQRDSRVFAACSKGSTPIVWNLAGGYQRVHENDYDFVIEGHLNTFDAAVQVFS